VFRAPAPADDTAITLALGALAHIAGNDALSARFLGDTGIMPGDVAARATDPDVLAAVLDFFLADEALLLEFAAGAGIAPDAVAAARRALPGGMLPHWT